MTRVVAIQIMICLALPGAAQACSPNASSTFCADGWAAQPAGRRAGQDRPAAEQSEWTGDAPADLLGGSDGIYVEGAVVIGEAPAPVEEPL